MIRFDKLTLKGQEALQSAQSHAQEKGNPQITPEHLLWALIEQKEGVVLPILQKLGVNLQSLAKDLADSAAKLPKVQGEACFPGGPQLNEQTANTDQPALLPQIHVELLGANPR